jgi:hypothetical protein
LYDPLQRAKLGPAFAGDMFDKNESPAWLQYATDLLEDPDWILDGAEDRCRHDGVHAFIVQLQVLSTALANFDRDAGRLGGSAQIRMHVPIRFQTNPADSPWKVLEIRTRPRTDFNDCSANLAQQFPLSIGKQSIVARLRLAGERGQPGDQLLRRCSDQRHRWQLLVVFPLPVCTPSHIISVLH